MCLFALIIFGRIKMCFNIKSSFFIQTIKNSDPTWRDTDSSCDAEPKILKISVHKFNTIRHFSYRTEFGIRKLKFLKILTLKMFEMINVTHKHTWKWCSKILVTVTIEVKYFSLNILTKSRARCAESWG